MAHGRIRAAREEGLIMVCYARPSIRMIAVVLVVLLIFGRAAGHFFSTAPLMVAVAVAAGGAAVAAALVFVAVGSIRRRRAVAGGCVNCRFRCQHAMTEPPRRPAAALAQREPAGPRWPDRPAYRTETGWQAAGQAERRERTGSAA